MSDIIKFDSKSIEDIGSIVRFKNGSNALDDGTTIKDLKSDELRNFSSVLGVKSFRDTIHQCEVFYYIFKRAEYAKWENPYTGENYKTFEEYLEYEVGKKRRTVNYYMGIWSWFGLEIGSEDVLTKFRDLGWSKLKELVEVVTESNADEWNEKARKMTTVELAEACKEELGTKKGIKKKKSKAKKDAVDSKRFSVGMTEEQIDMLMDALDIAKEISNNEKNPELLSFVAQDFVASNMFKSGNADKSDLINYFNKLESNLPSIKLIAINSADGSVIYGEETLEDRED